MPLAFVGSYDGTHASTSAQTVTFATTLRDEANALVTALQEGDVVFVAVENASTVDRTQAQLTPAGYTALHTDDYRNDSNDSNFLVSRKVMGATPDLTVAIPGSNATTAGVAYAILVLRGVGASIIDVAAVVTGGTNTGVANAGAVTPATPGAWIVVFAGAAVAAGAVFTRPAGMSTVTNHFRSSTITSTTNDATIGMAIKTDWTSGAYDPAAFGGSTSTNTGSWSAVTLAIQPLILVNEVAPATGSQLRTGSIPAVMQSTNQTAHPATGSITRQGFTPGVVRTVTIELAAQSGSVTRAGYAPAVAQSSGTEVAPQGGSIVRTGHVPAVQRSANQWVTPGTGSTLRVGYAPAVARSANQWIAATPGALRRRGWAAGVQQTAPGGASHAWDKRRQRLNGFGLRM